MPQLEQLLEQYPEKIKVVFKHFPLRNHRFAGLAAMASMAAHQQGLFWPVHDALLANYNQLNEKTIRRIVEEAGADMAQFEKDMQNGSLRELIARDLAEGRRADVRGTPTVFINGRRLENRSPAGFSEMIEGALSPSKK